MGIGIGVGMSEQINSQPLGAEGKAPNVLEKVKKIIGDAGYIAEWHEEDGAIDAIKLHLRGAIGAVRIQRLLRIGKMTFLSFHYDEKIEGNVVCIVLDLLGRRELL